MNKDNLYLVAFLSLLICSFSCVFYSIHKDSELAKKTKYAQSLTFQYGWLLSRQRLGVKYNREEYKKDSLHFIKTMYE